MECFIAKVTETIPRLTQNAPTILRVTFANFTVTSHCPHTFQGTASQPTNPHLDTYPCKISNNLETSPPRDLNSQMLHARLATENHSHINFHTRNRTT